MASKSNSRVVNPNKQNRMDVSRSVYNKFLGELDSGHSQLKQSLSKCSFQNVDRIASINILTEHIESLQTLRDSYTEKYIMDIRDDIKTWWDTCHYGEAQRSEFQSYSCTTFNVENLIEHEKELKNLQQCYDLHKDLYKLATKREKLWNEKITFENPVDGSAKFENRGGALIKELKKYQNAEKQLPVVEREIQTKVDLWERMNGKQFVMHDMQYVEYMEKQKDDYKAEKDAKRDAKKAANHEMQNESPIYTDSNNTSSKNWPNVGQVLSLNKESGNECEKPKTSRKSSASTPRKVSVSTPRSRLTSASSTTARRNSVEPRKKTQRALSNVT